MSKFVSRNIVAFCRLNPSHIVATAKLKLCFMLSVTVMVMVSLLGLSSPSVTYADSTGDNPARVPDVKTPEQWTEYYDRLGEVSLLESSIDEYYYKTLNVSYFKQETGYWCGPATVKQVLNFLNGTSQSQSYYAGETHLNTTTDGTIFSEVDNELNDHQTSRTYLYSSIGSFSNWKSQIKSAMNRNIPVVLDLNINSTDMPNYTRSVSGHILNVSGLTINTDDNGGESVRVTDPFDQDNKGKTLGNHWYSTQGVYNCNNNHSNHAMIY